MTLTLNATLQAAQDAEVQQPLIEIVSETFKPSIPFEGTYWSPQTANLYEQHPDLLALASGRLVNFYTAGAGAQLWMAYSDTDRIVWTRVRLFVTYGYPDGYSGVPVVHVTSAEMADGNIGVLFINDYFSGVGTNYQTIYRMIVSPTGAIISAATIVFTGTVEQLIRDLCVVRLANNTFMMVYAEFDYGTQKSVLKKRTSSDFLTWSGATTIPTSGLSDDNSKGGPHLEVTTHGLLLYFDYVTSGQGTTQPVYNIYYMVSNDNGTSWSAPTQVTSYTTAGTVGVHPYADTKADGSVVLSYTERKAIMKLHSGSLNWPTDPTWCGYAGYDPVTDIHIDPATGYLYALVVYNDVGIKIACAVVVIDTASWTIVRRYDAESTPALPIGVRNTHVWWNRHRNAGHWVALSTTTDVPRTLVLIDDSTQTVYEYNFNDYPALGIVKNVNIGSMKVGDFMWTQIDLATNRCYIMFSWDDLFDQRFSLGYIDLGEAAPYTFHYLWSFYPGSYQYWADPRDGYIATEVGWVLQAMGGTTANGRLVVLSLATGAVIKDYISTNTPGFHIWACIQPYYWQGKIYAGIEYHDTYGMENYRGLMIIDPSVDTVRYVRPTWTDYDDIQFHKKKGLPDGRLMMVAWGDGLAIYNPTDDSYVIYHAATVPGWSVGEISDTEYDPDTDTFYACGDGVSAFPGTGTFTQPQYLVMSYTGGWQVGNITPMVLGYKESDMAIAISPDDVVWGFWTRTAGSVAPYSQMWENALESLNLSDFLLRGQAVELHWSIDSPSTLSFSLSHGHLFDPTNLNSSWGVFLDKCRRINVRIGSRVGGVDYWQKQGTFLVRETSMSYKRGDYPTIRVNAEDRRMFWGDQDVEASNNFEDYSPANIITNILTSYGGVGAEDISIPAIVNSHNVWRQFLKMSVSAIIEELLDHFGYFSHITPDEIVTVKQVRTATPGTVDHAYANNTKLLSYSPDDSFSDLTNRIVVKGETREFVEVLHDEESVTTLAGVVGWWGGTETHRMWYSEDHKRKCRYPRLSITQSVRSFRIFIIQGGGSEEISATDWYEYWVEVTIHCPNLMWVIIATVIALIAIGIAAALCGFGVFVSIPCGPFIYASLYLVAFLFYLLATVAAYSYEIYARPIGEEKQALSAEANDFEFQNKLDGLVITDEHEDNYCYTTPTCQWVADMLMDIVSAQRRRVQFSKIAHLQDEVGDVISIPHPYSGQTLPVFIAELTRTFTVPEPGLSEDPSVVDSITGWRTA